MPFPLEDELRRLDGRYSNTEDPQPYTQTGGRRIIGQNSNSAGPVADALLKQFNAI